jgi:SAM-dependent methyltransferase
LGAKKFDVVTNFGTTEHIANQLNAFKIIHDLTAPGGIMIHAVPAQGLVNHGLLKYNPKWFWMLARSNDYRWLDFDYASRGHIADLPDNVVEAIAAYRPDIAERKARYKMVDGGLRAAFQKVRDIEFIPPLDVDTGTKTTNAALIERYWTVFAPR